MKLASYLQALRFLIHLSGTDKPITQRTTEEITLSIQGQEKNFTIDIYFPFTKSKNKSAKTILFVHGMGLEGKDDPRVIKFAQALQILGYHVIMPDFPEIKRTHITQDSILNLQAMIQYTAANHSNYKKIGLIAPSFSASIAFNAIKKKNIGQHIQSFMPIGGFANMSNVVRFILAEQQVDPYALMIILKNFFHHATGENENLLQAFEIAIADNYYIRNPGDLPEYLKSIPGRDRQLFHDYMENVQFRQQQIEIIRKKEIGLEQAMHFLDELHNIDCPIFLLHGDSDNVIEPEESQIIYEQLQKLKKPVKLVLTPFLSHGDSSLSLKKLPELGQLINGFAFFFQAMLELK